MYSAETFPLTVETAWKGFFQIPLDSSYILYHYTSYAGLEGILRSNGIWASHRFSMNDEQEFSYAQGVIRQVLREVSLDHTLPNVAGRLVKWILINLDNFFRDSAKYCSAYCACLSISRDHEGQWQRYSGSGIGVSVGFNVCKINNTQIVRMAKGQPYLFPYPVLYEPPRQREVILRHIECAIHDLKAFSMMCSSKSRDLTALYHRLTQAMVVQMMVCADYIKHPDYASEREMRVIMSQNDGTIEAKDVRHYMRGDECVPYLFFDLKEPITGRLPIKEIIVGPNAPFRESFRIVEGLLDELNYGSGGFADRPEIVRSAIA